jgi:hypothetical protein
VSSTEISRPPASRPADPVPEAPAPRLLGIVRLVPRSQLDARIADLTHDREFQL